MKIVFYSLAILILSIQGFIYWQSPKINNQAIEANNSGISEEENYETSITLPKGNDYINALLTEAANYNFDYTNYGLYYDEDEEEIDIPQVDNYFFHSLGKLKYLQLSQDYNSELKLMKSFVEDKNFFDDNVSQYMEYIDNSYLNNIYQLVEGNHVWEARTLVGLAYNRVNLFDAPPLSNMEYGNRIVVDEILLLNMLFNDPRLLLTERETLLKFIVLVDSDKKDFEILAKIIKESDIENIPQDIIDYFEGIKLFYKKDYKNSFKVFEKISNESNNYPLVDLSLIMQIRCIFWSQKWESTPWLEIENSKSLIKFIESKIIKRTIKSDVSFYLDSLNVIPFRKANYSPEADE